MTHEGTAFRHAGRPLSGSWPLARYGMNIHARVQVSPNSTGDTQYAAGHVAIENGWARSKALRFPNILDRRGRLSMALDMARVAVRSGPQTTEWAQSGRSGIQTPRPLVRLGPPG
jgi:hypothetical protein